MRQSELFSKTRKEVPKDEVSKNAKLLIKGGFIHKEMAGVYSFLPLGLRVLNKVNAIIRDEMNKVGGQEVFLASLQTKEVWQETKRWDEKEVGNWFKTKLAGGTELGLAFTHEEPLTLLMRDHLRSFRDLPAYVYQIQTKFRNEARAKSGLIRTREFLMKDLYSFSKNEAEHNEFYEEMKVVYKTVFGRVGIGAMTHLTYASGGSFSKYSHEFQTICDAGEDLIHLCEKCNVAVNADILKDQPACPVCGNKKLVEKKAVEVGNIFSLGTRFSDALGLHFVDEKNESHPVVMGSYGIGPGRLVGTAVEVFSDDKSILWPSKISPFDIHLVSLDMDKKEISTQAEDMYNKLTAASLEVLFDDRDARAGEKFADADLIGIPLRLVVSSRALDSGGVEFLDRRTGKTSIIAASEVVRAVKCHV